MDKHDPDFQWRTSISFFGRVVDQHGTPISGANAWLAWNDLSGSHETTVQSGPDGRFELQDAKGKALSVNVGKAGYPASGTSANRSFEYSAFFEPHYYLPDKKNPVLFQLWKLDHAEPMHFWRKLKKMTVDGQKVWFDTKAGTFGSSGDVAFSTKRGTSYGPRQFDWSFTVEAAPGGGIALVSEELMFEAPEGGYQPTYSQEIGGKDESYTFSRALKFYLKTPDGKYAAVQADLTHMGVPEAEVNVLAYVNPSGSRNLQYDAAKRIAPK